MLAAGSTRGAGGGRGGGGGGAAVDAVDAPPFPKITAPPGLAAIA